MVPRLMQQGHQIAVAAFFGLAGAPMMWQGMTILPGSAEDQWAQDMLPGYYGHHHADYMISLMDAWVLDIAQLRDAGMRMAHWMPVDCDPLGVNDEAVLRGAGGRPIAMSQFGHRMLLEAGFADALYVPHGVDTDVFRPLPDRQKIRDNVGLGGKFLIGMNAANQDSVRKAFAEQFLAFRAFHDRHPDSRMLIHTRVATRFGPNLRRIVSLLDLDDAVEFGDQYFTAAGFTPAAELAAWYACLDLLTNCSYGEGFGLPVLEAQACGTPVVVTDCSALTELAGPGWLVPGERWFNARHSSWWTRPSVPAITAAYEDAYNRAAGLRDDAREFAVGYDAGQVVAGFWAPALKELEEALP
jgi:glycosyltransferase involved in cell wall biosynthesis